MVKNFVLKLLFMVIFFLIIILYLRVDPFKSCLFLIRFIISLLLFLRLNKNIWFSYFICLIFVSGVLAILIYFSSLSNLDLKSFKINFIFLFLLISFFILSFFFSLKFLNLNLIFLNFYFILIFWVLRILVLFFNFVSFIISFLKGLRKF